MRIARGGHDHSVLLRGSGWSHWSVVTAEALRRPLLTDGALRLTCGFIRRLLRGRLRLRFLHLPGFPSFYYLLFLCRHGR